LNGTRKLRLWAQGEILKPLLGILISNNWVMSMEQQDIKTLRILEAFHQNPHQTQRDLSRKLKISLGMVNAFTRRLVRKGYFKVSTIPKRRIQYILTPKGLSEKTRLTYQYLQYSLEFYKETRAKLKYIFNQLPKDGEKKFFIIGVSELTEIAIITLQELRLELEAVVDNDKAGDRLLGAIVMDDSSLAELSAGDIVIITKPDTGIDLGSVIATQKDEVSIIDFSKF
jgi:DNA-binding MarR family transcriptional regulator